MTQRWSRSFRLFALAAGSLALAGLAWYARSLIAPLLISALLAYVLNPAVTGLQSVTRLSHRAAVIVVYVGGLAVLVAIPAVLVPVLLNEARTLTLDLQQTAGTFAALRSREVLLFGWSIPLARLLPEATPLSLELLTPVAERALQLLEATTRNLAWVLVILVAPYYLLQDWEHMREWLIHLAPEAYRPAVRRLYQEVKAVWAAYLRGQLALMLVVAVIFSLAWLAIGLPGALILGILIGLFSLVPELGPAVAAALAVLVALLGGSTFLPLSKFWFGVLTAGVYLVLINVKNIWLRPPLL
ncbi:MAG: AI-2E family transporter, partial [Chloroflexi bacterium]|nr:AI-2E family transporter [Chloroflexota bacterium]